MRSVILFLGVMCIGALAIAEAPTPNNEMMSITLNRLDQARGLRKVVEFDYDGKNCHWKSSADKKKMASEGCRVLVDRLRPHLQKKFGISEYINPKKSYYEVEFKTRTNSGTQAVATARVDQCTAEGDCLKATYPEAYLVARALIEELKISE